MDKRAFRLSRPSSAFPAVRARLLAAALAAAASAAFPAAAAAQEPDKVLMRISLENTPSHVQVRTVERFADILRLRSGGAFVIELYDSGRLFRDADVVAALGRGDVEMAAPGTWQLDKAAPDTAVLFLPSAYSRSADAMRAVADGPVGTALTRQIEAAARVVVLGRWLDLGHANVFGTSFRGFSLESMKGARIRVAGGQANQERLKALGAEPVSIPFGDLPSYLERGLVDGILSTFETVDSSGLDFFGLRSAYQDDQYYGFYVPMVGAPFWDRLTANQRKMLKEAWDDVIMTARGDAAAAQLTARSRLVLRGMTVNVPSDAERNATRERLLELEPEIAKRLGVSASIQAQFRSAISSASR